MEPIMKLYVTFTSPYARLARIMVVEKGLEERVAVIGAQTRKEDSPYYTINPSGRVPYLIDDAGDGMEDSQLICAYLDSLDGKPRFHRASSLRDWADGRLEARARSLCDGIAVWVREMIRPESERSPTVLAHEAARAQRLANLFEGKAGTTLLQESPAMGHLVLAVALEFARDRGFGDLTVGRPQLSAWLARMRELPSLRATASPASRGSEARR
jgi:glutathione S-transferase